MTTRCGVRPAIGCQLGKGRPRRVVLGSWRCRQLVIVSSFGRSTSETLASENHPPPQWMVPHRARPWHRREGMVEAEIALARGSGPRDERRPHHTAFAGGDVPRPSTRSPLLFREYRYARVTTEQ